MTLQTFKKTLRTITFFPKRLLDLIIDQAKDLTEYQRQEIVDELQTAQKNQDTLLEKTLRTLQDCERGLRRELHKAEESQCTNEEQLSLPTFEVL